MTTTATTAEITDPGVYDIPDTAYHADPVPEGSLSQSGAKTLLPPSCPALFAWRREHGRPDKRSFDLGHAAHAEALGVGMGVVVVEAEDWRTKAAQEQRKEAYAAGAAPVLSREYAQIKAMVQALRSHPVASALLDPSNGTAEQSLFWRDERSGVMLRARLDMLPDPRDGRMVLADYKTAESADPWTFARAAAAYGYPQQAAWYPDGVKALGLAEDVEFLFVVQEKQPPYLVSVIGLEPAAVRAGRDRNRDAIDLFARCRATGEWPGYSNDVEYVNLPAWYGAA